MVKYFSLCLITALYVMTVSCSGKKMSPSQSEEPTTYQEELISQGWNFATPNAGELNESYGVRPIYGIQDNYFDISIGQGYNLLVKIVNESTDKCIRYVYVPENKSVAISQIPQGRYYLKLAYGRDWMELVNGNSLKAKFTRDTFYERSTESYDFGLKTLKVLLITGLRLTY